MNDIKKYLKTVFSKSTLEYRQTTKNQSRVLVISCLFLAFIAFVLTVLNIIKGYWFMTATTTLLTLSMLLVASLATIKKPLLASIFLIITVSWLFSLYAITGQNYGFAILWIVLIPIISLNLLSIELGTTLSVYFQLFLFVIFYTPLKDMVGNGNYSSTFMIRFPFLFLCSFGGSFILAVSKEYNSVTKATQSVTDALTGIYNRAKFNDVLSAPVPEGSEIHVISFDLNGLKRANDSYGHEAGDKLITLAANILTETWDGKGMVFRLGGDEFAVILNCSPVELEDSIELYQLNVKKSNLKNDLQVLLSMGVASSDKEGTRDLKALNKIADAKMYEDKAEYYSKREHERRRV